MTVLILARDFDMTADQVVRYLGERDIDVCRVNMAWFPSQLSLSARLDGGRWDGLLQTPARTVELGEVRSVWYRAPETYEFPPELSAPERHHAFMEAKYGLGGVLSSLPVLWVNHPGRAADAAYKPVQLARAAHAGLSVPATVITNEADTARTFAKEGQTVTKLIGAATLVEDNARKVGFTRMVTAGDLDDLRGVELTAHCFQRWVDKAYEVRVVVIGEQLTAAAIHAGSEDARVDWRSDYDALSYELITLPDQVADGVRRLMTDLDLRYAALDFVVTPDEQFVFLEINPGGQFGWIEAKTGAPLTAQLADLLAGADA